MTHTWESSSRECPSWNSCSSTVLISTFSSLGFYPLQKCDLWKTRQVQNLSMWPEACIFLLFSCSPFTPEKSSSLTWRGKIKEEKKERKIKAAVVIIGIEESSNWEEEEERKTQKKQFWRLNTCNDILNVHKEWGLVMIFPPAPSGIWLSFAFKAFLTVLCPLKARASPCSSRVNEKQIFL